MIAFDDARQAFMFFRFEQEFNPHSQTVIPAYSQF